MRTKMSWRARSLLVHGEVVMLFVLIGAAGTAAQFQPPGATDTIRPAAIYAGTCDNPGNLVFELRDVVVAPDSGRTPEFVGAEQASIVEGSDSSVRSTTLTDLTGAPHVVAVFESEGSDTVVACGEIGGFRSPNDDDLDIGLREYGDSGIAGVALIDGDDDDNEVDIDIYLARDVTDSAATPST